MQFKLRAGLVEYGSLAERHSFFDEWNRAIAVSTCDKRKENFAILLSNHFDTVKFLPHPWFSYSTINNMADDSGTEHEKAFKKQAGFFSRACLIGPVVNKYDWALLICCFVTGLVDAASFSNWGMWCPRKSQSRLC